jgi:hypothetical protein
MRNEEISWNLEASIEGLKQITYAQKAYIQNLEHEHDVLAEGYRAAVEQRDELAAGTSGLVAQYPS